MSGLACLNLARKAVATAGDQAEEMIYLAEARGCLKPGEKEEVLEKIPDVRIERFNRKGYWN